jgi:hypothetical protein
MVEITVKDSVYIHIDCDQDIGKELTDFFTFIVPGAEYTPAFKYRKWDGKIRLFNMYKGDLYRGLLSYVIKFCEDRKYKCHVEESLRPSHTMSHDDVEKYMTEFLRAYAGGREITPHAHQIDAVYQLSQQPTHASFVPHWIRQIPHHLCTVALLSEYHRQEDPHPCPYYQSGRTNVQRLC